MGCPCHCTPACPVRLWYVDDQKMRLVANSCRSAYHWDKPIDRLPPVAQASLLLSVVMKIIVGVGRRGCNFLLKTFKEILRSHSIDTEHGISATQEHDLAQIPSHIDTAVSRFNLDGRCTIWAVCPRCMFTHEPRFQLGSTRPEYDSHCINRKASDLDVCNEPLLQAGDPPTPIKPYVVYDFDDYLSSLLSRSDLEACMDDYADAIAISMDNDAPEIVTGIEDAVYMRTLKGPDGKPFFLRPHNEGRYAFVFFYDGFNVEGSRIRGRRLPMVSSRSPRFLFLSLCDIVRTWSSSPPSSLILLLPEKK